MIFDKQAQLVRRLYEKTMAGEIEWKPAAKPDAFVVSFPNYSVVVSEELTEESLDIQMQIINKDGELADSFTDVDLKGTPGSPVANSWFKTMEQLHGRARRIGLGSDRAIDDILGELE